MHNLKLQLAGLMLCLFPALSVAAPLLINTDPFQGSTALTTPGRQIVGGEPSISFDSGADQFVIDLAAFATYGFGPAINFFNGTIGNLPTSGSNVIVLRTFDDDNNSAIAFGASNAANLIAALTTVDGAGFFIYFNSALNLPRLVFSTNLNDSTADLRIIARLTNLTGAAGQNDLANFTANNFSVLSVPEPASFGLLVLGLAAILGQRRRLMRLH